ncbi:MAG: TIGR01777 family oxidoreductase [Aestuariibacter sp.]
MNILLTGASGLIGKALLKNLVADGHHVLAVSRSPEKAQTAIKKQYGNQVLAAVDWCQSIEELQDVDAIDAVINLAGEPIVASRWTDSQKRRIENSRWLITKQLVDLIHKSANPPAVFISGSAIGYYGRQDSQPIDEDYEQVYPEFSHQLCKRWENIAMEASSDVTRVCLLRTGIVLSNKGGALDKMVLPFKLGLGGPIGDGKHFMSWIHIEDMVSGILHLLHSEISKGAYNLTAPNPANNKDFAKALAKALSRPALITTPKFALRLLLGEMADLLIYGQNVLPTKLQQEGFEFRFGQLDAALQDLNL